MKLPALYEGPPMLLPVFGHGPLSDTRFVGQLLEHRTRTESARLRDYRTEIPEALGQPIVLEAPGETVPGIIYRSLTHVDLERLDAYQGVREGLYRRVVANAEVDGGDSESVYVYAATVKTLRRYRS